MPYPLCRHIRTNGLRCKAAALTGQTWCFFHEHLHRSHQAFRPTETTRAYRLPGQQVELTALEDRESVQLALSVVINALASGQLDTARATALLYGLQVASSNAANLDSRPGAAAVRTADSTAEGLALAEPAEDLELNEYDDDDLDEDDDDEDDEDDDDDDSGS